MLLGSLKRVFFGANIEQACTDYKTIKRTAMECEAQGFDFIWLSDHLYDVGRPQNPYLECWTLLSALAEATSKIRLCTIVMNNLFRHPPLLAKMAATLDEVSGGRLDLGVGAGWYEEECAAYGIPFPKTSDRIGMLDEALTVIKRLWVDERVSYEGRFYRVRDAYLYPKPIQKPHPPIWIGIMKGRRRMLELVGKHADAWTVSSLYLPSESEYAEMCRRVEEYKKKFGRGGEEIKRGLGIGCVVAKDRSSLSEKVRRFKPGSIAIGSYVATQKRVEGTPEECVERLRFFSDLGLTYFVMNFPDVDTLEPIRLFGERVIPEFRR
jgi:alkanesulfonate monooxygenase SsuD/methylene tetrahydromethanopterin reductase-like flavin-dependent oxidoreductase (luciferase family)